MKVFELTFTVAGDFGPARMAVVTAIDAYAAKMLVAQTLGAFMGNITYILVSEINYSAVLRLENC